MSMLLSLSRYRHPSLTMYVRTFREAREKARARQRPTSTPMVRRLRGPVAMTNENALNAEIKATTDAAQLLLKLRIQHSSAIPITVWRVMYHAESKLNR